ncbi:MULTISPECIES: hypothetical protein [Pseudomonas]|uniref:hypothetical protein n=1 Tax=Pseudomonas TaxID=286 RepID=UPI0002895134|nr:MULTISPECIES: hypothetical protein [Pseudomonas]AMB77866.1 hypothetical protein AV641_01685 [Pseudomonas fragi]NBF17940.1 hypothetical protein [Pseudomonas sp. Fl4BN2]NNG62245.1 hypothetical protein [Pseudomonas sp. GC01]MCH4868192.1 hypothetical protein [Pseudomonas sp. TMW22089]NBG90748.1 hypothetical protein [Pseudomonas sp. 9.1(2019)]
MKASKPKRIKRDDHQYDEATRRILDRLRAAPALLDELEPTRPRKISPRSPFAVLPDIPALEALVHVSVMLKSAEEVSDEITEMASGIERGLVWSLVHSVEMARSLVDALLQGNGVDPEQLQRPG